MSARSSRERLDLAVDRLSAHLATSQSHSQARGSSSGGREEARGGSGGGRRRRSVHCLTARERRVTDLSTQTEVQAWVGPTRVSRSDGGAAGSDMRSQEWLFRRHTTTGVKGGGTEASLETFEPHPWSREGAGGSGGSAVQGSPNEEDGVCRVPPCSFAAREMQIHTLFQHSCLRGRSSSPCSPVRALSGASILATWPPSHSRRPASASPAPRCRSILRSSVVRRSQERDTPHGQSKVCQSHSLAPN